MRAHDGGDLARSYIRSMWDVLAALQKPTQRLFIENNLSESGIGIANKA